jgi:hypothetical protein
MEYFQGTGYAVSKLLWSSTNTPKAIVPQSQLYPPAGGGALVADATMRTVSTTSTVTQAEVSSSLPTITSTVSPNPVTPGQSAILQINSDKTGTVVVNIVNSNGLIISTQKVNLVAGLNTTTINTSSLGRGFYIINITGGSTPVNIKLLVE